MILWMCSYFGFFDKNVSTHSWYYIIFCFRWYSVYLQVPSKRLVAVINEHLSGLQPEYIQLITFFIDSRVTAKEPSDDHLFQLFCPPKSSGEYIANFQHLYLPGYFLFGFLFLPCRCISPNLMSLHCIISSCCYWLSRSKQSLLVPDVCCWWASRHI